MHAGGTDLLGCLRDGVFAAPTARQPERHRRAARDRGDAGGPAHRRPHHARRGRREPARARALHGPRRGRGAGREPAAPQPGHARRQPLPAAALLVLPRRLPLPAQGRRHLLRAAGENQYHAIFGGGPCFIVHPSDTAPALMALEALAHVVGPGAAARSRSSASSCCPSEDLTRETVLEPGEILTECPAAAGAGLRSTYRKVRARASWDFALAGAAIALRAGRRVARARVVLAASPRCRGAPAVPRRRSPGSASTAPRSRSAAAAATASRAAREERLQGAAGARARAGAAGGARQGLIRRTRRDPAWPGVARRPRSRPRGPQLR